MSEFEKPFLKKIKKRKKKTKNQCQNAACEQKTTSEKANFCSYTVNLKLEQKNFTPQNHSPFRSTSCFGVTKITNPI